MSKSKQKMRANLKLRYCASEEALVEQLWRSDDTVNISILEILSEVAPTGFEQDFVWDAFELIEDLTLSGFNRFEIAHQLLLELRGVAAQDDLADLPGDTNGSASVEISASFRESIDSINDHRDEIDHQGERHSTALDSWTHMIGDGFSQGSIMHRTPVDNTGKEFSSLAMLFRMPINVGVTGSPFRSSRPRNVADRLLQLNLNSRIGNHYDWVCGEGGVPTGFPVFSAITPVDETGYSRIAPLLASRGSIGNLASTQPQLSSMRFSLGVSQCLRLLTWFMPAECKRAAVPKVCCVNDSWMDSREVPYDPFDPY